MMQTLVFCFERLLGWKKAGWGRVASLGFYDRRRQVNWGDKPVTAPRQRFNKTRIIRRVVESLPEPLDGCVQSMFKIHEGVGLPELPVKLFARNQLSGVFEKTDQDLDRLPFQADFSALLLEFSRTQIKLEDPEPDPTRNCWHWFHWRKSDSTESITESKGSAGCWKNSGLFIREAKSL
jgi:hypothetical protein